MNPSLHLLDPTHVSDIVQHHQQAALSAQGQRIHLVDAAPQTAEPDLALARGSAFERLARDPVERHRSERGDEAHSGQIVRWPFRETSGR